MIFKTKATGVMALVLATATLGMHAGLSAKDGFNNIYFFGESLSDPGNIYALTGETAKAPYEPIPGAAYAIGGHQFSNGKTWAQRFAQNMQMNKSGKAAFGSSARFGNYAFGGTRLVGPSLALSASDQVNLFLADHAGVADSEALYVLQFGGNDVRDALEAYLVGGPAAAQAIIEEAVAAEIGLMLQLYGSGARHFLITNVPNIGLTPAVGEFGPLARLLGAGLSAAFNDGLAAAMAFFLPPDASIKVFDLFDLLNEIAANPAAFGISDTVSPCLSFGVKADAICGDPDAHLFWDAIHPTAAVHQHAGNIAAELYQ